MSVVVEGSVATWATTVESVTMPEQPPATMRIHARDRPPRRSPGELSTTRAVIG